MLKVIIENINSNIEMASGRLVSNDRQGLIPPSSSRGHLCFWRII